MARRKSGEAISGWVCLDKPVGLTSTQAVGRVRRLFNAQKAGHAGTLDPLAEGILPIALGEATKTVAHTMDASKSYRFSIAWGRNTTTLDAEGETTATSDLRPEPEDIATALKAFVGTLDQVPPAYSAIKVAGERAYDLARAGQLLDLPSRLITIHDARLVGIRDRDHAEIEIDCGKGTYVRALARDLAFALGTCGHVSALRRTRVGAFASHRAFSLENLEQLAHKANLLEAVLSVETALDDIPALAVTSEDAFRLKQGRSIVLVPRQVEALAARLNGASRTVSALENGKMVALCEMRVGQLNPIRVFHLT